MEDRIVYGLKEMPYPMQTYWVSLKPDNGERKFMTQVADTHTVEASKIDKQSMVHTRKKAS